MVLEREDKSSNKEFVKIVGGRAITKKKDKKGSEEKDSKKDNSDKENDKTAKDDKELEESLSEEGEIIRAFESEFVKTDEPKVALRVGLETEVAGGSLGGDEENVREVDLSGDYNLRAKRNQDQRREPNEGAVAGDNPNEPKDLVKIYEPKNRDDSNRTFYDGGGKDSKKDIYSPEMIGDRGEEKKFIHEPSDLEKKSEETTMGGFGIATKRRKGEDKNPYDEMGRG